MTASDPQSCHYSGRQRGTAHCQPCLASIHSDDSCSGRDIAKDNKFCLPAFEMLLSYLPSIHSISNCSIHKVQKLPRKDLKLSSTRKKDRLNHKAQITTLELSLCAHDNDNNGKHNLKTPPYSIGWPPT